jgi:hypothetical protein
MSSQFRISGDGGDEEAAAIAVVLALLEAEGAAADDEQAAHFGWRDSARLMTQGLAPTRLPAAPGWGRIERLRRAGRGGGGVVGQ